MHFQKPTQKKPTEVHLNELKDGKEELKDQLTSFEFYKIWFKKIAIHLAILACLLVSGLLNNQVAKANTSITVADLEITGGLQVPTFQASTGQLTPGEGINFVFGPIEATDFGVLTGYTCQIFLKPAGTEEFIVIEKQIDANGFCNFNYDEPLSEQGFTIVQGDLEDLQQLNQNEGVASAYGKVFWEGQEKQTPTLEFLVGEDLEGVSTVVVNTEDQNSGGLLDLGRFFGAGGDGSGGGSDGSGGDGTSGSGQSLFERMIQILPRTGGDFLFTGIIAGFFILIIALLNRKKRQDDEDEQTVLKPEANNIPSSVINLDSNSTTNSTENFNQTNSTTFDSTKNNNLNNL